MDRVSQGVRGDERRTSPASATRKTSGKPRGPGKSAPPPRGARRTSAEPLSASWNPEIPGQTSSRRRRDDGKLMSFLKTYGWRVYAVPVLLVISALVVVDTANGPSSSSSSAGQSPSAEAPKNSGAAPKENPAKAVDLKIPTAELPPGGEFTKAGNGSWHIVPGSGPKVGTSGRLYTYTVEVEDGIDPSSYTGDDAFAKSVDSAMSDPRGWIGSGVSLQRVDGSQEPDFRISLTTPETNHRPDVCGFTIPYEASCYNANQKRVVINLARWVRGALAFNGEMGTYRQYALNHEVGHALEKGHVGCAENGALAPVMMQQTFGVSNNYVAQLNQVDPSNYAAVPADGKVCKVNAWPNPQAGAPPS